MKKITLLLFAALLPVLNGMCATTNTVTLSSPDGNLAIRVTAMPSTQLHYEVIYKGHPVVEKSPMGLILDRTDAGYRAAIVGESYYEMEETYPWVGIHNTITNRYKGVKLTLSHPVFKTIYLDLRAFNDGVAFAFTVPGTGSRTLEGESTLIRIPAGSTLWYHDFYMHYEGQHIHKDIANVNPGEWMAPPITVKLKDDLGYLSLSEAAIGNYCGMGFQAEGGNALRVRLAHEQPASYPFLLRYGEEEAKRLSQPPVIAGPVVTPWRTIVVAPDLNTLVNNDISYNLSPDPDPKYFPDGRFAEWLKPGRAVWGYLTTAPRTLEGMKQLSKEAAELGFEYHVVEGHWARWTEAEQRDLIDYSKALGVKILLWKHSKSLWDKSEREAFFKQIHDLGAAGAKIDFFDHEALEIEQLYLSCLELAARYHLVLDFHGAAKPTGEPKTWPNELTREAVKGFETRGPWAGHNATLPFTRMVAGHADYTPMHFGDRKTETTDTHQIASAVIISAPMLIYAEDPANILRHPAVEVIKQIPGDWDETRVLAPSAIGEVAVFARRKGDRWFLAALNGPQARTVTVDLSFLGNSEYSVTLVRDEMPRDALVSFNAKRVSFGAKSGVIVNTMPVANYSGDKLVADLLPAGGMVAMFEKK